MKKQKNNFKLLLTIFGVYEVIIVLLLSFEDLCVETMCLFSRHHYCDFCEYRGFQYVLLCLLVPIIFGLLLWWRKELVKSVQNIKKTKPVSRLFSKLLGFKIFDVLFGEYKENPNISKKSNVNKKTKKDDKNDQGYGWQYWD